LTSVNPSVRTSRAVGMRRAVKGSVNRARHVWSSDSTGSLRQGPSAQNHTG
jgi:hypothetical protein